MIWADTDNVIWGPSSPVHQPSIEWPFPGVMLGIEGYDLVKPEGASINTLGLYPLDILSVANL